MKPLEMDVYMDHVEVEGQLVSRPNHISRSWWIAIWESFVGVAPDWMYCPNCGHYHRIEK